jgi:hypothetical protein
MRKKLFVSIILFFLGATNCYAELLDLGGKKVELIDGNVTDDIAKQVISFSDNLYGRGAYRKSRDLLTKLIRYYRGSLLPEAYYLRGKTYFMDKSWTSSYTYSFIDFVKVYDGFRNSNVVTSKKLQNTAKKAAESLLAELKSSDNRLIVSKLDPMIRYTALYKYITGNSIDSVESYLDRTYQRRAFIADSEFVVSAKNIRETIKQPSKVDSNGVTGWGWGSSLPVSEGYEYFALLSETGFRKLPKKKPETLVLYCLQNHLAYKTAEPELHYLIRGSGLPSEEKCTFRAPGGRYLTNLDQFSSPYKSKYGVWSFIPWEGMDTSKSRPNYQIKNKYDGEVVIDLKDTEHLRVYGYQIKDGWNRNYSFTAQFPSVRELVTEKHGSVYDWLELKRVENLL